MTPTDPGSPNPTKPRRAMMLFGGLRFRPMRGAANGSVARIARNWLWHIHLPFGASPNYVRSTTAEA